MLCDWAAMMEEECQPSPSAFTALSDTFSPANRVSSAAQERSTVLSRRIMRISHSAIAIEEVLGEQGHCLAITYEVPRLAALETMARASEEASYEPQPKAVPAWQSNLVSLLNSSPVMTKSLAYRYARHSIPPTADVEHATVREVTCIALVLDITIVDYAAIESSSGGLPRHSFSISMALPRPCGSPEEVEDAIVGMLDDDGPPAPQMWI